MFSIGYPVSGIDFQKLLLGTGYRTPLLQLRRFMAGITLVSFFKVLGIKVWS